MSNYEADKPRSEPLQAFRRPDNYPKYLPFPLPLLVDHELGQGYPISDGVLGGLLESAIVWPRNLLTITDRVKIKYLIQLDK